MISLVFSFCLSSAGIRSPHPAADAAIAIIAGRSIGGAPGNDRAIQVAPTAPSANWPSAPIFQTLQRKGQGHAERTEKNRCGLEQASSKANGTKRPLEKHGNTVNRGVPPMTRITR
jgi:hypothetical protein